ncbi:MAG: UDP-N-acetylmuramoyl-L-alanyl-D-glutamate--2,6-diaminopimelate ligase [Candidatus Acetothermia bacterium]
MKKRLSEVLEEANYEYVRGDTRNLIRGISYDSRSVEEGDLFIAVVGENADGHDYIKEAVKRGAVAIVGQKDPVDVEVANHTYVKVRDSRKEMASLSSSFYEAPTTSLFTVGITGTNGKTTTAHLSTRVLGEEETGALNTLTNEVTPGITEPVTTPESPEIQKFARRLRDRGTRNFVLEVSSHSLELNRVNSVNFDVGVFTNLTRDHLDYHSSMEEYKRAKEKLFRYLTRGDTAIINGDEDFGDRLEKITEARTLRYGLTDNADVVGDKLRKTSSGVSFKVTSPRGEAKVELGLFGRYNVYNALAAFSVGLASGMEPTKVAERLRGASSLPGRMERLELENGADIYVDFAHNPGAFRAVLRELAALYKSVSVVFGCGGESDRGKRPAMGQIASEYGDFIYLTDDNPKKEDRLEILHEIEHGIKAESEYQVIPERKEAIERAVVELPPKGVLLIAGKGHEDYQIVGDEWISYNDREFVEKICKKRSLI